MDRKILMAIDDSIYSQRSLQYASRILSGVSKVKYSLYHGQPIISQFLLDEAKTDSRVNAELKKVIQKNHAAAQKILEKNKERLIRLGIADENIDLITQPRMLGLAKDILEIARKNLYDAIIVGRRGLSRIQETLMGSVSTKILEHSETTPVWVVDGDVTSDKIMIAVDGSECSAHAIDYLSFITGENAALSYILLHVMPAGADSGVAAYGDDRFVSDEVIAKSDRRFMEKFFTDARKKFKESGVGDNRLEIKSVQHGVAIGKVILEEAKAQNCGTVVFGRRGVDRAFFSGSVSQYITRKISGSAMWLVT